MEHQRSSRAVLALALLAGGLAGCVTTGDRGEVNDGAPLLAATPAIAPAGVARPAEPEALVEGRTQFRAGNYGNAERAFRRAVEANAQNGEAWLGLAATYDQLRRFDLADKGYEQAQRLLGARVELFNNLGWSHLLRGDRVTARRHFERARAIEPNNPVVLANLAEVARR